MASRGRELARAGTQAGLNWKGWWGVLIDSGLSDLYRSLPPGGLCPVMIKSGVFACSVVRVPRSADTCNTPGRYGVGSYSAAPYALWNTRSVGCPAGAAYVEFLGWAAKPYSYGVPPCQAIPSGIRLSTRKARLTPSGASSLLESSRSLPLQRGTGAATPI